MRDLFHKVKRPSTKFDHYFDIYERYLSKYRGTDASLLEIGIAEGGSLELWREYLGKEATIIGVDHHIQCSFSAEENIMQFQGRQENKEFWSELLPELGELDIVIDDGGHKPDQQISSFESIFPYLTQGGVYICEDIHTSFWPAFHGGPAVNHTFVGYAKGLIFEQNWWALNHVQYPYKNPFVNPRDIKAIHFYPSIIVIEKGYTKVETIKSR